MGGSKGRRVRKKKSQTRGPRSRKNTHEKVFEEKSLLAKEGENPLAWALLLPLST